MAVRSMMTSGVLETPEPPANDPDTVASGERPPSTVTALAVPAKSNPSKQAVRALERAGRLLIVGDITGAAYCYWEAVRMYASDSRLMEAAAVTFRVLRLAPSSATPERLEGLFERLGLDGYPLAIRAAELLLLLGQGEQAARLYTLANRIDPEGGEALEGRARIAFVEGRTKAGVDLGVAAVDAYVLRGERRRARRLLVELGYFAPERTDVRVRIGLCGNIEDPPHPKRAGFNAERLVRWFRDSASRFVRSRRRSLPAAEDEWPAPRQLGPSTP